MADQKLEIEIVLDDGTIKKGFAKIESGAKKASGKIDNSIGKSFLNLKTVALAAGAAITGAFAVKAIRLAAAQEEAVNKFETALLTSGKQAEISSEQFQEFASSLQQVTRFGDEATLEAAGLIQSLGQLSGGALERSTIAAQDLASALGIDLQSAATLVGKAASGDVGSFSRYGLSIKKAGNNVDTLNNALEAIEGKFGGAAREKVKTFAGATEQLGNSFGDTFEAFGRFIVKSPAVIKIVNDLSAGFATLTKSIDDFAKGGGFTSISIAILSIAKAVNFVVTGPLEVLVNFIKAIFKTLKTGAAVVVDTILAIIGSVVNLLPDSSEFKQAFNGVREASQELVSDLANDSADAGKNILSGFEVTNEVDEYINDLLRAVTATEEANTKITTSSNDAAAAVTKAFTVTNEAINKALGKSLAAGVQGAVKSLAKGENAFEGFAKTALAAFGGFLVELGQGAILVGIAATVVKEAVEKLQGPAAIAAGIALVALGSAFQSIGSGGGADTSAPSQGADTGNQATELEQKELVGGLDAQRNTEVNIDVTGQVVDPRGTALQIAELLRDVQDSNGEGLTVSV